MEYGTPIHEKRAAFLEVFIPIFKKQYAIISGDNENVSLNYESKLVDTEFLSLLEKNIDRDKALQYTSVGIHKDDLAFKITDYPIKKFGSQGQQKSFLIALKFAQFHFMKELAKTTPILLLDDIFDKLDENRVSHIIALVDNENFGQILLAIRTQNERKMLSRVFISLIKSLNYDMRRIAYLVVFSIFFGCTQKVSKEDIKHLNGYWEIVQVTFPNGQTKDFAINPTVDYIELKGMKGFRKKVQPKFDGSYNTSNDAEVFTITEIDDTFEFHYKMK